MTWQDFGAALGIVLGLIEVISLLLAFRARVLRKGEALARKKRQERLEKKKAKLENKKEKEQ